MRGKQIFPRQSGFHIRPIPATRLLFEIKIQYYAVAVINIRPTAFMHSFSSQLQRYLPRLDQIMRSYKSFTSIQQMLDEDVLKNSCLSANAFVSQVSLDSSRHLQNILLDNLPISLCDRQFRLIDSLKVVTKGEVLICVTKWYEESIASSKRSKIKMSFVAYKIQFFLSLSASYRQE